MWEFSVQYSYNIDVAHSSSQGWVVKGDELYFRYKTYNGGNKGVQVKLDYVQDVI